MTMGAGTPADPATQAQHDELMEIAQDPKKRAKYPTSKPHVHQGVEGMLWTFPDEESVVEYSQDRTLLHLEGLNYFQAAKYENAREHYERLRAARLARQDNGHGD